MSDRSGMVESLLFALLFLGVRLLVLFSEAPALHRTDELYAGAVALEMAAGRPTLPWALLAHAPYCGGSILVALGARVLFPLLGPSVLVLRLPSLLLSVATFVAWRAIVARTGGARAARLFGLLFALAPVEAAKLDVLAWGNHAESRVLTALALLAGAALLGIRGQATVRNATPLCRSSALALALASGLAGGLALFFSYAALAFASALAALLLVRGWRRGGLPDGALALHVLGLALGAAPAAALAFARGLEGPSFLLALVGSMRGGAALENGWRLARYGLRFYLMPEAGLPRLLEALPWVAALAGLGYVVVRAALAARRSRLVGEMLVALPALVFLVVFCVSSLPVGPREEGVLAFRYLSPLTPFLVAATSLLVVRLPARLAWTAATLLALAPFVRLVSALPQVTALPLRLSGASYLAYGGHALEVVDFDVARAAPIAFRLPDGVPRRAAWASILTVHLGEALFQSEGRPGAAMGAALARLPASPELRSIGLERMRLLLEGPRAPRITSGDLPLIAAALARAGEDAERAILPSAFVLLRSSGLARESLATEVRAQPAHLRGLGLEGLGRSDALHALQPAPPAGPGERSAYLRGYGEGRARARLASHGRIAGPLLEPRSAGDGRALESGSERALRAFEPEDTARRDHWRARCNLRWETSP